MPLKNSLLDGWMEHNFAGSVKSTRLSFKMCVSGGGVSQPVASGAGMFRCPDCGKLFMHERTLKRHAMSHNVTGQFACTECGKQYSQVYFVHLANKLVFCVD